MFSKKKSDELFNRARIKIPGAVNSPVRAWNAVGGAPLFIARGEGAFITDADGNRFIDYVGSYGPAILGHAHPHVADALAAQAARGLGFGAPTELEVELAEAIAGAIRSAEKVRLVSSGTEAGMTAIRIARAATGRPRIIKFDGCYHGHSDSLLVRSGSGGMTLGIPDSAGVPGELAALTMVAAYNSLASVEKYFKENPGTIAAVIVEPVAANMGVVLPEPGFLKELADLAHRNGALLICDEVITGFRLCFGSVSEKLGVAPDLIMLGKIIGGGMPIGAVAGPAKIMDLLAPVGPVYQAGTLSGNPLSVRAGLETIRLLDHPGVYERLDAAGARLEAGLRDALARSGEPGCVNRAGSLLTMFLGPTTVRNAEEAKRSDAKKWARFFHAMLERGVNIAPSQFEAMFISLAHTDADLDRTIEAARQALDGLRQAPTSEPAR
ncbi:MAG TPA: glutamate-1-semialdehyde 2,1-aminomutase [Candidatus Binataceae bacterium]|nr:glutamate-1-semialdehyde 2,1-aminomutase [Candidatus Binataceae bacterium]